MTPDLYTQLLERARKYGAKTELTGRGHWKITKGDHVVFVSQTPSDVRAVKNLRALLRRHDMLPRPHPKLTDEEVDFLTRLSEHGRGLRCAELPPKRLLDKGFVRIAKRSKGWIVWLTEKGERDGLQQRG